MDFHGEGNLVIFFQQNETIPSDMCEPESFYPLEFKEKSTFFTDTYLIGIRIEDRRDIDNCHEWISGDKNSLCTNVNEFQNLLFILTGEELVFEV